MTLLPDAHIMVMGRPSSPNFADRRTPLMGITNSNKQIDVTQIDC